MPAKPKKKIQEDDSRKFPNRTRHNVLEQGKGAAKRVKPKPPKRPMRGVY